MNYNYHIRLIHGLLKFYKIERKIGFDLETNTISVIILSLFISREVESVKEKVFICHISSLVAKSLKAHKMS